MLTRRALHGWVGLAPSLEGLFGALYFPANRKPLKSSLLREVR